MKFNISFFIVLIIACIAIIGDILLYVFNLKYIVGLLLSIIIVFFIFFILLKKKSIIVSLDFNKFDLPIFLFFITYVISRGIMYVDTEYDTSCYHIYLQTNPFIDKINFDFFPGRIFCCFLFPLGDRINYIFRYFLGIRFGTIFSYFLIIVLFYQTKRCISLFTKKSSLNSIFALLILGITTLVDYVGTYYVDNIGTVFLLEAFYIVFKERDIIKSKNKLYILALIMGIAISIKVSNIFCIALLGIWLLYFNYKNIKELKIKTILICVLLFFIPFFIYIFDNYKQTGSILFPYYNGVIKSEWFGNYNWVEPRFGIDGLKNKALWPIINTCSYEAYGDEKLFIDPIWGIGYICVVGYIIINILNKNKSDIFKLACFILEMTVIWIVFLYGYVRYACIIPILNCVFISAVLLNLINKKKIILSTKKKNILFWVMIVFVTIFSLYTIIRYFSMWSKINCKVLFKDRQLPKYQIHIDGIWGSIGNIGCDNATLVREENTPIICLEREYFEDSPKALEKYEDFIYNNSVYILIVSWQDIFLQEYAEKYNFSYQLEECYSVNKNPLMDATTEWALYKIEFKH